MRGGWDVHWSTKRNKIKNGNLICTNIFDGVSRLDRLRRTFLYKKERIKNFLWGDTRKMGLEIKGGSDLSPI